MKVTYQGETGAYSEMAVYKFFGSKVEPVPCKDFREVFESVKTGAVPNGVVPIENSIEGSVNQNYDLFLAYDLKVCGEVAVKLAHVLIGNPQTKFEDIKTVYSPSPSAWRNAAITLKNTNGKSSPPTTPPEQSKSSKKKTSATPQPSQAKKPPTSTA